MVAAVLCLTPSLRRRRLLGASTADAPHLLMTALPLRPRHGRNRTLPCSQLCERTVRRCIHHPGAPLALDIHHPVLGVVPAVLRPAPSSAQGRSLGAAIASAPLALDVHHPILGMVTAVLSALLPALSKGGLVGKRWWSHFRGIVPSSVCNVRNLRYPAAKPERWGELPFLCFWFSRIGTCFSVFFPRGIASCRVATPPGPLRRWSRWRESTRGRKQG